MNKEFTILKKDVFYEIKRIINNTAYLESSFGKNGLFNINTRQLIGDLDFYNTSFDEDGKFYFQEKTINENPNKDINNSLNTIRIYDALEEELLLDNWKIKFKFPNYYLVAVESPYNKKVHLFDINTCREDINIFYKPLDGINLLYQQYNDILLVLKKGEKKGLYYHNHYRRISSIIEPIEFDSIEKLSKVIVFQKNNQKLFIYTNEFNNKSETFDDITIDKENDDILYCKKGKEIFVYNINIKKLILKVEANQINYIHMDFNNHLCDIFYFDVVKNNKHKLISSNPNVIFSSEEKYLKGINIFDSDYDGIMKIHGGVVLKEQEKYGLFVFNSVDSQLIKPRYDKIEYLINDYYALYTNDYCDIGKVLPNCLFEPIITKCKIVEVHGDEYILNKNNQYGILFANNLNDKLLPLEYSSCRYLKKHCYILKQNNKEGLFYLDEYIIPIKYDKIGVGSQCGYNNLEKAPVLYFSLQQGDKYKLAKLNENDNIKYINTFNSIDFFNELILLKDQQYSYMFSYEKDSPLIKRVPIETTITIYDSPYHNDYYSLGGLKKQIYCIDGKNYYLYNNRLYEVFVENTDLYVTKYITDTNIYEVSGYNPLSYNKFCSDIENDDNAEKTLNLMSEEGLLEKRYPTLVLKRKRLDTK